MQRTIAVVAALLASCSSATVMPDAGVPADSNEGCPPPTTGTPDFFGESCAEEAYPAVTVCHAGAGWCISNICFPSCKSLGCRRCDFGSYTISPRGACYCRP